MQLDFVKGHMGGNTIALLDGRQVPAGREIELAKRILTPNYLGSHEAGLLYPPAEGGTLKVKIVEPNNADFISACGGMTQVLGKALLETFLADRFGLDCSGEDAAILLETDAGMTEIRAARRGEKAGKVVTDMTAFAEESYELGIRPMLIQDIPVTQAGKFMVVEATALQRKHPGADFENLDEEARRALIALQAEFRAASGLKYYDYTFYDGNPLHGGDLRAVYPHYIPTGHIEPACGTGTVALGLALLEAGKLPRQPGDDGSAVLTLETGGGLGLGGPDHTELHLTLSEGKLARAAFSHSLVEITAAGRVIV